MLKTVFWNNGYDLLIVNTNKAKRCDFPNMGTRVIGGVADIFDILAKGTAHLWGHGVKNRCNPRGGLRPARNFHTITELQADRCEII